MKGDSIVNQSKYSKVVQVAETSIVIYIYMDKNSNYIHVSKDNVLLLYIFIVVF